MIDLVKSRDIKINELENELVNLRILTEYQQEVINHLSEILVEMEEENND